MREGLCQSQGRGSRGLRASFVGHLGGHVRGLSFDLSAAQHAICFFRDVLTIEVDGHDEFGEVVHLVCTVGTLAIKAFIVGSLFGCGNYGDGVGLHPWNRTQTGSVTDCRVSKVKACRPLPVIAKDGGHGAKGAPLPTRPNRHRHATTGSGLRAIASAIRAAMMQSAPAMKNAGR
jgi:hypothetical protein